MVQLAPDGSVEQLVIKQPDRGLRHTWSIAIWQPEFTDFLHQFLRRPGAETAHELYVGNVIQAALDEGSAVTTQIFEPGASTDMGTPEALANPPEWGDHPGLG